MKYKWPGNVRELKNLMERLVILHSEDIIKLSDLPAYMYQDTAITKEEVLPITIKPLKEIREEAEKLVIKKALDTFGNNLKEVAKVLDIDLSSLYRKLKQYQLEVDE